MASMSSYEAKKPIIDTILANHRTENLGRIVDALSDSDGSILALEAAGETKAERACIERALNAFLAGSPSQEDMEFLIEIGDGLFDRVATRFEGTGKKLYLVDASCEDRVFRYIHRSDQQFDSLETLINSDADIDLLRHVMRCLVAVDARAVALRDRLVACQVRQIMQIHPGEKITVFQGALHSRVSHELARIASVSRLFVPSSAEEITYHPQVKMSYEGYNHALRQQLFLGSIADDVIDEALLQFMLLYEQIRP